MQLPFLGVAHDNGEGRRRAALVAGAYFSIAPFFGALMALAMGDAVTPRLLAAGALMALGPWLHLSERHEHEHAHPALFHEHEISVAAGTRHRHPHWHEDLAHSHTHYPDELHRHRH